MLKGKKQYLIKWEGYDDKDNSWEYKNNIFCEELIEEFEANKRRERRPSTKKSIDRDISPEMSPIKSSQRKRASSGAISETDKKPVKRNVEKKIDAAKRADEVVNGRLASSREITNEWKDTALKVLSVYKNEETNTIHAEVEFKSGTVGVFPVEELHVKCPIVLLEYYEANISFTESSSEKEE
jgi:hypothetical protein